MCVLCGLVVVFAFVLNSGIPVLQPNDNIKRTLKVCVCLYWQTVGITDKTESNDSSRPRNLIIATT